jgi:pimeloyl-ACP methyl ester carboxylesterase
MKARVAKAKLSHRVGRRLALILIVLFGPCAMLSDRAEAQAPQTFGVDRWLVYGTALTHGLDPAVPGGAVLEVKPRAQPGEPWSSGAGMVVPGAITSGERVTAVFWARSAGPTRVTIALQGGAPGYSRFATAEVALTPSWQQLSVSGTAPASFAAETQSLSVPLGQAKGEVFLGPVAFLRGDADRATARRAFGNFRPSVIVADVRIQSERGVNLAGTLYLPTMHGPGPYPIAVLIQGHGPNGRGGFPEIIKRLTADGIAALEYDKRGIGQSTGTYEEDVERLTVDAAAAVAAMRRRPEIDASRVALVGHSQGGVIAPAVAAADPSIRAVVTLAGSVGNGLPYLARALRNQMTVAGVPEAVLAPAVDAATALLQARINGEDAEAIVRLRARVVDRFQAAGFPRPQAEGALAMIDTPEAWQVHKLRSASDLKALHVPVLAIFGTMDTLVVAADEAKAARAALAGNPRARVVVMDGLSHWFQEGAVTGRAEEVSKLGPNLGSPRVVALVGEWLRDTLALKAGKAGGQARSASRGY